MGIYFARAIASWFTAFFIDAFIGGGDGCYARVRL